MVTGRPVRPSCLRGSSAMSHLARGWRSASRSVRSLDGHRSLAMASGEHLLEIFDLGQVVGRDVGVLQVLHQKILVIGLGGIEGAQRVHARHDGATEYP